MRVWECLKDRQAEEVIAFGLCYSLDTDDMMSVRHNFHAEPNKDADTGQLVCAKLWQTEQDTSSNTGQMFGYCPNFVSEFHVPCSWSQEDILERFVGSFAFHFPSSIQKFPDALREMKQ